MNNPTDDQEDRRLQEVLVEASHMAAISLDGGFVACSNCGDQEDTGDMDFVPQLIAADKALRDHRAKVSAPEVVLRCEPPEELRDERWHWLKRGDLFDAWKWIESEWLWAGTNGPAHFVLR